VGKTSNRTGIGARLLLTHEIDGVTTTQMREVNAQTGFRGQSAMVSHFGVGDAERITRLEVHWPSGQVSAMTDLSADQLITISEDG
jgi:hypothetical protein